MSKETSTQLSIEFGELGRTQDIVELRGLITDLPSTLASQGLHLSGSNESGWSFYYFDIGDAGISTDYRGSITFDQKQPTTFTYSKTEEYLDSLDTFHWPEYHREITFTGNDGMLVTEAVFGDDDHGSKSTVIGHNTHPASQKDVTTALEYVRNLPSALEKCKRISEANLRRFEERKTHRKKYMVIDALARMGLLRKSRT